MPQEGSIFPPSCTNGLRGDPVGHGPCHFVGWLERVRFTRVEGQVGRWKQVIGDTLRFHTDAAQATEIAIAAEVLNRMLDLGRPEPVCAA
jgi:hypothetical protein